MRVVDMHCDTILELLSRDLKGKEASLYSNDLSIDLEKMKKGNYLLQNFALFTDQKEPSRRYSTRYRQWKNRRNHRRLSKAS